VDEAGTAQSARAARAERWLLSLLAALLVVRVVYHARYLLLSPFARVTLSDGQVYEDAARDLLAHPPWGTQPFFLQGLYAYVLALGMALEPVPLAGLCVQLAIAALALGLCYRALVDTFGVAPGRAGAALLLSYPMLAFYENKYLSASLGVSCNVLALVAFLRLARSEGARLASHGARDALLLGLGLGASMLGRPNMLLAVPFALLGVWQLARHAQAGVDGRRRAARLVLSAALGTALALAPMALRNAVVIGAPDVFPSHGGGIPFFIGNNPNAQGLWNSGGGMLSGQVAVERAELQQKLGLGALQGRELDRTIGEVMYGRAFSFIAQQPRAWLRLTLRKLALCLGNAEHAHDYDVLGESELLGSAFHHGVPFAVLLGLGALGFVLLWRGQANDAPPAAQRALCVMLLGQSVAIVAANVIYFHAAQHRLPWVVPLAFGASGALCAFARSRGPRAFFAEHRAAIALALVLCAQAFVPRGPSPTRPTASHRANLAAAYEVLGEPERALSAYAAALAQSPRQPMLHFRQALLLEKLGHRDEAIRAFERTVELADRDPLVRGESERALLRLQGKTSP